MLPDGEYSPPIDPLTGSSNAKSPEEVQSASVDFLAGRTEGKMNTYTDMEGDYAIVPTKHAVLDALREPGEQAWTKKINLFQQPPAKIIRDADTGKDMYPSSDFFRVDLLASRIQKGSTWFGS